ncbi:hypothetical protein Cni_G14547 [Canna indica]|uniref:Uncharacterized protein n=1 Tax=Canna indica TaxID=4628 RepID=A0AAQ3KI15_9LILI|nr:hypothetical protein Cni_G14547 [Canna indica]
MAPSTPSFTTTASVPRSPSSASHAPAAMPSPPTLSTRKDTSRLSTWPTASSLPRMAGAQRVGAGVVGGGGGGVVRRRRRRRGGTKGEGVDGPGAGGVTGVPMAAAPTWVAEDVDVGFPEGEAGLADVVHGGGLDGDGGGQGAP